MIVLLYLLVPLAIGSLPLLHPSNLRRGSEKINLYNFNPSGVGMISPKRKPNLSYGSPSADMEELNDLIESYSVATRLHYLKILMVGQGSQRNLIKLASDQYPQFHLAQLHIDVRVLRLLFRMAANRLEPDEIGLNNACDIVIFCA